jgi:hypothetical protein
MMEEATEPAVVHATSGACPICDEPFDDLSAYTEHLADEHDLVDEEGSASSFGVERVVRAADFRPEFSLLVIPDALSAPPPRPTGPPHRSRPLGLVALVVALVVGLGALVALAPDRERGDDQVALRAADETMTTATGSRPANSPPTVTSAVSGPGGGSTTEPGPRDAISSAPTVLSAAVRAADLPPTTPVTTPPTTTTIPSGPPPAFALPSASGAVVERCERVKNRQLITYSWRFEGGSGWHAPTPYTVDGAGRYQDVLSVPGHGATTIGSVQVIDQDGTTYDVLLQPALPTNGC